MTMRYRIKNTQTVFERNEFAAHFPNTSLPVILTQDDLGFLNVEEVPDPTPPLPTAEELAANQLAAAQIMQRAIVAGMDDLFDTTAQTRRYDNRITCALRAGYVGPFQAEGQAFATWMDTCNALAYTLLAEVQAGTRPMPATVSEALSLLPAMVWPT